MKSSKKPKVANQKSSTPTRSNSKATGVEDLEKVTTLAGLDVHRSVATQSSGILEKPKKAGKPPPLIPGCLRIDLFGDLLKFSKKSLDAAYIFKKYDVFATSLAKESKEQRILLYQFLLALCLTAHARRLKEVDERKEIFEVKNQIFLNLANASINRSRINFRILINKRFKVTQYCDDCTRKNVESGVEKLLWKYCSACKVDRDYYNVLSVFHKFADGGASFFLGNELIPKVAGSHAFKRIPFGKLKEEVAYLKYKFSPANLIAIELASALQVSRKILEITKNYEQLKPYIPANGDFRKMESGGSNAPKRGLGQKPSSHFLGKTSEGFGPASDTAKKIKPKSKLGVPAFGPGAKPAAEEVSPVQESDAVKIDFIDEDLAPSAEATEARVGTSPLSNKETAK